MALGDTVNPLIIGRQHIRLKRVHSTNRYATDMVSKSKPIEGTVISASFQYEGRGQIGRYWESEDEKNITCSTILRPIELEVQHQFYLNIAIALAIHDLVDHFLETDNVKVKWPNDIYVSDKKIAGILIQNSLRGKYIDTTVIGTGININQINFSEDIPNPTSLAIERGSGLDIDPIYPWLFRFLTKRYLQVKAGHFDALNKEYHDNLYRKDEIHTYIDTNEKSFQGQIVKVDNQGRLHIKTTEGETKVFCFREVKYVM